MIRIAIADDESSVRSELSQRIKDFFCGKSVFCEIQTFESGTALLGQVQTFDLYFLDIQMEGLSGMETAKRLRKSGARGFVVFVTVLQEYVYEAFEVEASDYILKPVDTIRFVRMMDRIYRNMKAADIGNLLIPSKGNTYQSLLFREIYFLEAVNHKIEFHTKDATYEGYFKVAEIAKLLDKRFFQCHRSYFVNLDYVCGYENGFALMVNKKQIPVSRLRNSEFSKAVLCYMKEKREL